MARYQDKLPEADARQSSITIRAIWAAIAALRQPREVLARSGKVIDPPRARERSFCCGAGGGLAFLGEESGEIASATCARRNLAATGASIVGTACPFCNTMFRDALVAISDAPPQLLDIAQIAAQSIANATATPSNGAQNV